MTTTTTTLWACTDCLLAAHDPAANVAADPAPLGLLAGTDWDVGSLSHGPDCGGFDDCDGFCDVVTFSTAPCDGCGSALAGARNAFTVWGVKA